MSKIIIDNRTDRPMETLLAFIWSELRGIVLTEWPEGVRVKRIRNKHSDRFIITEES